MGRRPAESTSLTVPARLDRLFDGFTRAGLRWTLLRSPEALAEPAGDIDVLVAPGDLGRVRRIVAEHGFAPVPMPRDLHAADYDATSDRFLWLHVQPELRLGSAAVAADDVLAVAVGMSPPRLPDDWLLWTLVLHGLLDKGAVAERHRPTIARLHAAAGAAAADCPLAAVAARHGLAPARVLELVTAGDWGALERLPVLRPPLPGAAAPGMRPAAILAGARRRWRERGVAVAVIGPDGAGKTTLVEALRRELPLGVDVLYMGLTGGRLPRADALRIPGLVLASRLAILWVRYGVGLAQRLRRHVVVFDRYVLDGTVPSGAALGPLARASRRLQAAACPRPDLVLLLDASGGTLHRRSGEYDASTLETWRAAYARLRDTPGVAVIDAEQPADAVRREALTLVWRCCTDRWRRAGR